jgi:hypothetical protein
MWAGFFAWFRGLDWGGALRVSQVQLLQPFLSMLFALPLLGERLDAGSIGFALAVVATVVLGRRISRPAAPASVAQGSNMNPIDPPLPGPWHLAARAAAMNPRPSARSSRSPSARHPQLCRRPARARDLSGGRHARGLRGGAGRRQPGGQAVAAIRASEGLPELRQWVAAELGKQGARVSPEQV